MPEEILAVVDEEICSSCGENPCFLKHNDQKDISYIARSNDGSCYFFKGKEPEGRYVSEENCRKCDRAGDCQHLLDKQDYLVGTADGECLVIELKIVVSPSEDDDVAGSHAMVV